MKLIYCIVILSLSLPAFAQAPSPKAIQEAVAAARKVVANANAAVMATKEYQALVDAQAALKAVEALIPVVQPSTQPKP